MAKKKPARPKKPQTALVRRARAPIANLPIAPPLALPDLGQFVQIPGLSSDPVMIAQFVGRLTLKPEQIQALRRKVDDEEVDWKPAHKDGNPEIPYLSHNGYRDRLDAAFGLGGWGMVPVGLPKEKDGVIYTPYALCVDGVPRIYAWGEQAYHENNRQMTYGDALEGTKSNAILRCGKELGIARDLWNRNYIAKLKDRVPVKKRIAGAVGGLPPVEVLNVPPLSRQTRESRPLPTRSQSVNTQSSDTITDPQRKRFWVIMKKSGRQEDAVRGWLKAWGVESTKDIRRDQYDDFVKAIESPGPLWGPEPPEEDREPGEDG